MPPEQEVEAPEESGQATETEAPDTGQATESEESFADFDPSQVPEEARPYVEGLQKEWQANYTKKRQAETSEIEKERQEAAEIRQFAEALENDPAARDAWLRERHGYQFDEPEAEEYLDPEDELRARLEAVEGTLTAQQQEFAQEQQSNQALDEIAEGIAELEKSWGNGFEFEGETLKAVEAYALVHGPQAIPEIGKAMQQIGEQDKQKWIASKTGTPRRISQGTAAKRAIDPSNREDRYKLYDEVAEEAADSMQ